MEETETIRAEAQTARRKLPCVERDHLLGDFSGWSVESGYTDPDGVFGEPRVETTWVKGATRIKDIRHPAAGNFGPASEGHPDTAPCEHYYWEAP